MSHDPVNHPDHYTRGGIETIDVIEAKGLGFHLGNAVKYLLRAGHKGDAVEDVKKARWYLDRWLEREVTLATLPSADRAYRTVAEYEDANGNKHMVAPETLAFTKSRCSTCNEPIPAGRWICSPCMLRNNP